MYDSSDIMHSLLVVSASDQFDSAVRRSIPQKKFGSIEFRKSSALARRFLLERECDVVIINMPLSDETGEELALYAAEESTTSVILAVPREVYSAATEVMSSHGILVISKQDIASQAEHAISFMGSWQDRISLLEQKLLKSQNNLEEQRIITRAKFLLVENKKMTEDDAHRYIGKLAMDRGVSRANIARLLLDEIG